MTIPSTTDDLIAEIELDFQSARKLGREAYIDMQDGEALIARIRELEQYKSEAIEVIGPVLDYARPLNLAKLGESITRALIADHQRLVALEQADRWRDIDEEMPEEDMRVLVWCDDGADAWPDTASQHNSFFTDEYHELLPVTHWKPVTPP